MVRICLSFAPFSDSSFSPWSLNNWSSVRVANLCQASNTPFFTCFWSLSSWAQNAMSKARWGMEGRFSSFTYV